MTAVDPPANPSLTAYLAGRDQPCPQCGYNLRDLPGSRCPECGDVLTLRLGVAEPRLATLIVGLVALSGGAGFNALLLALFAILSVGQRGGGSPNEQRLLVLLAAGLLIEGFASYAWVKRWPRVRRTRWTTRLLLVLGCWGLTLADLTAVAIAVTR